MFKDEPIWYLSEFKEFLIEQLANKEEPSVTALIAEIDRELSKRAGQTV